MPNHKPQPKSLEGHTIPAERLEQIEAHMAVLSSTALTVSDMLALNASAGDMIRVLENEPE